MFAHCTQGRRTPKWLQGAIRRSAARSPHATPVGLTGRMNLGNGVRAEGIRAARAASIWSRRVAAEGIANYSPYIRLTVGMIVNRGASGMRQ